jgi:hypothetical protein
MPYDFPAQHHLMVAPKSNFHVGHSTHLTDRKFFHGLQGSFVWTYG